MKDRRYQRLFHNDKQSSFKEILEKMGQALCIIETFQTLATDMLQIKHGQTCEIATDIFAQATKKTNSRKNGDFRIPSVNTVYHCPENTFYLR